MVLIDLTTPEIEIQEDFRELEPRLVLTVLPWDPTICEFPLPDCECPECTELNTVGICPICRDRMNPDLTPLVSCSTCWGLTHEICFWKWCRQSPSCCLCRS